jgi:hypothetical protein
MPILVLETRQDETGCLQRILHNVYSANRFYASRESHRGETGKVGHKSGAGLQASRGPAEAVGARLNTNTAKSGVIVTIPTTVYQHCIFVVRSSDALHFIERGGDL